MDIVRGGSTPPAGTKISKSSFKAIGYVNGLFLIELNIHMNYQNQAILLLSIINCEIKCLKQDENHNFGLRLNPKDGS